MICRSSNAVQPDSNVREGQDVVCCAVRHKLALCRLCWFVSVVICKNIIILPRILEHSRHRAESAPGGRGIEH